MSHSYHKNTDYLKMLGKDNKVCVRWRGDRVALYPISFVYDLSGENVFVMFLKRSLYLSEHMVVNFATFSYFKSFSIPN